MDASNVELAFQNILTGKLKINTLPRHKTLDADSGKTEIYRIVSSKALDGGDGAQATIGAGTNISLSKPADDEGGKGGKCC